MNILKDTIKPSEQVNVINAIIDVKIIGSTFRVFESEQLIKDSGRVRASERNSGNLIKIWRSLLYQKRNLVS